MSILLIYNAIVSVKFSKRILKLNLMLSDKLLKILLD
jgi:hypothetical protein